MPNRPAEDVFNDLMTPEQIARSDAKAENLKAGAMIARLRQERGWTQKQLADELGVTQPAVSQMEWGENIEIPTFNRAIAALGASLYVHTPSGDYPLSMAAE